MAEKLKINPGDKFGRWTVVEEVKQRGYRRYFLCECSCPLKTRKENTLNTLRRGESLSCGCLRNETNSKRSFGTGKDFTWSVFGRLTVLYEAERTKSNQRQMICKCSCDGNIDTYRLNHLTSGKTKSCGCYSVEKTVERSSCKAEDYYQRHPLFCQIEEIRDNPRGSGIEARCKNSECRKWFEPTKRQLNNRIMAIEKPNLKQLGTEKNFYCSDECKGGCISYRSHSDPYAIDEINPNTPTDNELRTWREEVLKQQKQEHGSNFCIKCQSTENLAAHHIDPKKLEPFFALDPENGFVTCYECHDEFHKGECSTGTLANKVCK